MGIIIGIVMMLLVAIFAPMLISGITSRKTRDHDTGEVTSEVPGVFKLVNWGVRIGGLAIALLLAAGTSYINVGDDEIAQMKRIYFAKDLPAGRIIGLDSQKGKKAETYGPGFHIIPFINVLNEVEMVKMITVPPGHWASLSARDGKPLPAGVTYAPSFQSQLTTFLDAPAFLTTEEAQIGFKGPQTTVLPPGTWRVNTYLWDVGKPTKATNVAEGTVAVIKSNAVTAVTFGSEMTAAYPGPDGCHPKEVAAEEVNAEALATPLVPVGCIGIWDTPLGQGQYYINTNVFSVTAVPVRVQAWEYEGGFTSRSVALDVDAKGDISQSSSEAVIDQPESAAAGAIDIKIDGYTIHQGARILVQVDPKNAPFIVASVGSLQEVEDRVVTPATQSTLRDLAGAFINVKEAIIDPESGQPVIDEQTGVAKTRDVSRPIAPMDLIENREKLQAMAEAKIRPEGAKAGVTIKEVRFLRADLPPEVLIPRKRTQLAFAMVQTMEQERKAQDERVAKEAAAATADKQADLVKNQIAVQQAEQRKQEQKLLGEGERLKLEEIAKGQAAQVAVLGEDRVMQLRVIEMALGLIEQQPEILQHLAKLVPDTYVAGGGEGGLDVLGALMKRGMEKSATTETTIDPAALAKALTALGVTVPAK